MSSTRRSKLAALVMFCLIAVVVLGGMSWATVATLQLARLNVREANRSLREQHLSQALRAATLMDNYIGGILNAESARPQSDYMAHSPPAQIRSKHGEWLPPDEFLVQSPLITPPHDWIDLYFHVEGGLYSSPQLPDEAAPWTVDCVPSTELAQRKLKDLLDWLQAKYKVMELHERVVDALERDHNAVGEREDPVGTLVVDRGSGDSGVGKQVSAEFQKRRSTHRQSQRNYLPPGKCVPGEELVHGEHDENAVPIASPSYESVESKPGEFAGAFWLMYPGCHCLKLLFVREGTGPDGQMVHQGFVADWDRLKPILVGQIDHLFPTLELLPISTAESDEVIVGETKMASLPVYLDVPDVPELSTAEAWASLRPRLVTIWLGAAAVLVVAGWGLRNLVNLTERRSQFAYSVTHELRTPLTTFRLYSDMLAAGLVPESAKQQYLDTLNTESIRLANLVEGVLEYARLENHRVKLNVVETDAPALLKAVEETLHKQCVDNGIMPRAETTIANGLPLRTDVDVVNRIAAVLVNNACRHARHSAKPTVVLRLGGENGHLHMDVIDSGPGVDRRDARRIFKPFRRGRGADAAAQGGIGLGLALARSWAKLLGGRLELAARHEPTHGGAHFRLTIPSQSPN